ncbi:basic region leucine zipper [Ancylostoma caninum]|uniref:Basic region leucine zipper n=1 Tax=Ancylostoma caninum TaxID=29170 RepID=A0A368GYJ6_ANCCA|nr:basic region leucine zipper [Ancylostoma caninum]
MSANSAAPDAFSVCHRSPEPAVHTRAPPADPLVGHPPKPPYDNNDNKHHSCLCCCEQWTDLSSIELIVSSTNLVTMSNMNSSDHTSKMNDDVAARFPNADWQFDVTDWPHVENCSYESPPYSHEIYAGCSPSIGYPVDLNDIDAAFDCDISMLDAYLHSPPSCSTSTEPQPHTQPSSSSGPAATQPSAPQPSSTLDTDPIEEFFPDLCDVPAPVPSPPQRTQRRRNLSAASMRSSTSRYSPYSIDSSALDADAAYSEYRTRRDKNNLASQRSRQKRVEKMRQMKDEKEALERRNIELKTLLSSLEVQVADYKRMVLMVVSKSA